MDPEYRPGFSVKKVVCDVFMFVKCLRMVRKNRYDLIHAVEESAFIAAAMQRLTGIPDCYDMDSPSPNSWSTPIRDFSSLRRHATV